MNQMRLKRERVWPRNQTDGRGRSRSTSMSKNESLHNQPNRKGSAFSNLGMRRTHNSQHPTNPRQSPSCQSCLVSSSLKPLFETSADHPLLGSSYNHHDFSYCTSYGATHEKEDKA